MKYILFISVATIFLFSCSDNNRVLENYYNKNIDLHQVLADSLRSFCKKYHTEVTLRRRLDGNDEIFFSYYVKTHEPIRIGIEFDSALKRIDHYPEITSKTVVPIEVIKLFKKMMYTSLIGDSVAVFYGHTDSYDGNSKHGILLDKDTSYNSRLQKIEKDVYLAWRVIP